jgi:hypothetical protein
LAAVLLQADLRLAVFVGVPAIAISGLLVAVLGLGNRSRNLGLRAAADSFNAGSWLLDYDDLLVRWLVILGCDALVDALVALGLVGWPSLLGADDNWAVEKEVHGLHLEVAGHGLLLGWTLVRLHVEDVVGSLGSRHLVELAWYLSVRWYLLLLVIASLILFVGRKPVGLQAGR